MATQEEVILLLLREHIARLPEQTTGDDLTTYTAYKSKLIERGEYAIRNCISRIPLAHKPDATLILGGSDYFTDYTTMHCTGPRLEAHIMSKVHERASIAIAHRQTTAKVAIAFLQVAEDDIIKKRAPNSILGRLLGMAARSTYYEPVPAELEIECAGVRVLITLREHLKLPIKDDPLVNVKPYLNMCADFIDTSTNEDDLTLILCRRGINRSVTMLLAFLIKYTDMTHDQAYSFLQINRPVLAQFAGCTFSETLDAFEEVKRTDGLEALSFPHSPIVLAEGPIFALSHLRLKPIDKSRLRKGSLNSISSSATDDSLAASLSLDPSVSPAPSVYSADSVGSISHRSSSPVPWCLRGRSSPRVSSPTFESDRDTRQSNSPKP